MIPIANKFLISEATLSNARAWAYRSLAGRFGGKMSQMNRVVKPSPVPEQKIENTEKTFNGLVPTPTVDSSKLGFKTFKTYKNPANLP